MGKEKSNEAEKNKDEEKKNNGGGKNDMIDIVIKIDLHCEGCVSKITKSIRSIQGVELVKRVDGDLNKLKVVGKLLDLVKMKDKIEEKTKKKVEIISPAVAKKDDSNKENKKDVAGDDNKKNNNNKMEKQGGEGKKKEAENDKKSKELPVNTAVLKVYLHCEGCMHKIHKLVTRTKGFMDMSIDRQKDLVTVKGTFDVKALVEALKEKLKRPVEIVPAKKEDGGAKKEKADGGNSGGGGGEKAVSGGDGGVMVEGNKMVQHVTTQYEYGYPFVYGPGYMPDNLHAPQLFSDENPNACVVM